MTVSFATSISHPMVPFYWRGREAVPGILFAAILLGLATLIVIDLFARFLNRRGQYIT